jgi:hypothetical protein
LKNDRVVAADPVIDREARLQKRPIGLVERQDAERRGIREISGNVLHVADVNVVHDGVAVVEMKTIAKVVGVRSEDERAQEHHRHTKVAR